MVSSYNDDFEVTWRDPEDAKLTWKRFARPDEPLPLLVQDILRIQQEENSGQQPIWINGYAFVRFPLPPPRTPPQEVVEQGISAIWFNEYQPRVRDTASNLRNANDESLPVEELAANLEGLSREMAQAFASTVLVVGSMWAPTEALIGFCEQQLGEEGPRLAATVLQGYTNESAAASMALGELAEVAGRTPEVSDALRQGRFDNLKRLNGGAEFQERLDAFLDEYGWRAEGWRLLHKPTWREDPTPALRLISRFLSEPGSSPSGAIRRAVEQRERTLAEVESRLPEERLGEFHNLLAAAQDFVPISESRAYWQLTLHGSIRVPVIAMGQKLTRATAILEPGDVWYLSLQEVRDASSEPMMSLLNLVQRRKEDLERWAQLTPPEYIGAPPLEPSREQPSVRLVQATTAPSVDGQTIRGQAASAGAARGRARIIRSLNESDRLEAGDILVCRLTSPPWMALFSIAAGVVSDTGGVLSHSAICAREFTIPCVVATQVATTTIPDGAMITIDGSKGTVVIED